jgi:hypothetical protein
MLFQKGDQLYLFQRSTPVRRIKKIVSELPAQDVWALVDGFSGGRHHYPHPDLLSHPNIRIVMTASAKDAIKARDWLKEKIGTIVPGGMIYMRTWTRDELFLVGCVVFFFCLKALSFVS